MLTTNITHHTETWAMLYGRFSSTARENLVRAVTEMDGVNQMTILVENQAPEV